MSMINTMRQLHHSGHPISIGSNRHRRGMDIEHMMRLGGQESFDIVARYTGSVRFKEGLRVYRYYS